MAKKRTSLKGKLTGSGESEEKGKGIDLLFGGTPEDTDDEAADDEAVSASGDEPVVPAPPSPTSAAAPPPPPAPASISSDPAPTTPIGAEAADDFIDPDALPVAMEAPPPEAEDFIDPDALPVALEAPPAGEEPIIDPDALPVAMEAPPLDEAPAIDPDALPAAYEEPDLGAGLEISMDDITTPPDPAVGAPELAVDPAPPDIVPPISSEPVFDPAADIPDIGGEADIVDGGVGDLGGSSRSLPLNRLHHPTNPPSIPHRRLITPPSPVPIPLRRRENRPPYHPPLRPRLAPPGVELKGLAGS